MRLHHFWLTVAGAAAASLVLATRDASAQRRRRGDDSPYTAPAVRVVYVDRPITTTHRHLSLYGGLGGEYVDYYRHYPMLNRPLWGLGAHFEASYGITDNIEVGAGIAARFGERFGDLAYVAPDRYGRVNREWVPTHLALARQPYTLGHDYVTNPYARARFAFVNRLPVMVGLDLVATAPVFANSCFTATAGVPVHLALGHVFRLETGVYNEFIPCEIDVGTQRKLATDYWTLMFPLRLLFQLTPRFWLGLRSGFETMGYSLDARNFAIPLGIQAGVRVIPRVDLLFHVVAPEFVHTDPVTHRNVWLDRIGTGVALQAWLL